MTNMVQAVQAWYSGTWYMVDMQESLTRRVEQREEEFNGKLQESLTQRENEFKNKLQQDVVRVLKATCRKQRPGIWLTCRKVARGGQIKGRRNSRASYRRVSSRVRWSSKAICKRASGGRRNGGTRSS